MLSSNKKIFYINSANRESGTDSDFAFKLNIDQNSRFNKCVILQALIPKSYYLIQSGQNTFTIQHDASTYTITIPEGNYSRSTFQSQLTTQLNAASSFVYSISYPSSTASQTGKYTFNVSGNGGVQPQIIFTSSIYECMGFTANSTNVFVGDTLTSINIIKLQAEDAIFIHSDLCQNADDNVLQEIYASENSNFTNITFKQDNVESYAKTITSIQNNVYRFYITNESGYQLSLNGLNCNITLMLYQENNFFELIKNYLKLQLIKN